MGKLEKFHVKIVKSGFWKSGYHGNGLIGMGIINTPLSSPINFNKPPNFVAVAVFVVKIWIFEISTGTLCSPPPFPYKIGLNIREKVLFILEPKMQGETQEERRVLRKSEGYVWQKGRVLGMGGKGTAPFSFGIWLIAILFHQKMCFFISKVPIDKNKNYGARKLLWEQFYSYCIWLSI